MPSVGSAAWTGCLLRLQADLSSDCVLTGLKRFGLYLRLNRWRLCTAFSTCKEPDLRGRKLPVTRPDCGVLEGKRSAIACRIVIVWK